MNEQDRPAEGGARAVSPGHGAAIPTGDVVAHEPAIGTPERFENPGLPAHVHRLADTDEKAAKRAEKAAAGKVKWRIDWEPSNADVFYTEPSPFTDVVIGAVADSLPRPSGASRM